MKHSTGKPTKAEAARMTRLKGMTCIACYSVGHITCSAVEIHHLLSGNKRRGHLYTIPLCAWHHRGDSYGWSAKNMEGIRGPSLARTSKKFHAVYGSDEVLLRATNELLELRNG